MLRQPDRIDLRPAGPRREGLAPVACSAVTAPRAGRVMPRGSAPARRPPAPRRGQRLASASAERLGIRLGSASALAGSGARRPPDPGRHRHRQAGDAHAGHGRPRGRARRSTLTVTSDHDDELHAHGFEIERDVKAGVPTDGGAQGRRAGPLRGRDAPPRADAALGRRALTDGDASGRRPARRLPAARLPTASGRRQDLPLPFTASSSGGRVALVVSFVALGALWREPRLRGATAAPAAAPGSRRCSTPRVLRAVAVVLTLALTALDPRLPGPRPGRRRTTPCRTSSTCWLWVGLAFALDACSGRCGRWSTRSAGCTAASRASRRLDPDCAAHRWSPGYWPAARRAARLHLARAGRPRPDRPCRCLRIAIGAYVLRRPCSAPSSSAPRWFPRGDAVRGLVAALRLAQPPRPPRRPPLGAAHTAARPQRAPRSSAGCSPTRRGDAGQHGLRRLLRRAALVLLRAVARRCPRRCWQTGGLLAHVPRRRRLLWMRGALAAPGSPGSPRAGWPASSRPPSSRSPRATSSRTTGRCGSGRAEHPGPAQRPAGHRRRPARHRTPDPRRRP